MHGTKETKLWIVWSKSFIKVLKIPVCGLVCGQPDLIADVFVCLCPVIDTPEPLKHAAKRNVLLHLEKLADDGAISLSPDVKSHL